MREEIRTQFTYEYPNTIDAINILDGPFNLLKRLGTTEQISVVAEKCGLSFRQYSYREGDLAICIIGENAPRAGIAVRTKVRLGEISDKNRSLAQEVSRELLRLPYLAEE